MAYKLASGRYAIWPHAGTKLDRGSPYRCLENISTIVRQFRLIHTGHAPLVILSLAVGCSPSPV